MKKHFFFLTIFWLLSLGGSRDTAFAWDGETFSDKWKSYWTGVSQGLDRAGEDFQKTFLSVPRKED